MIDRRNRIAVKGRLRDLAESMGPVDLGMDGRTAEAIPVGYDFPPDDANQTALYFGSVEDVAGDSEPSALKRGTAMSDDYTISGRVDIYGCPDAEAADKAAESAFNAFEAVLARCHRLIDPTGEIDDGFSGDSPYDVQSAYVQSLTYTHGAGVGDTFGGRAQFTIRCRTEIRRPAP